MRKEVRLFVGIFAVGATGEATPGSMATWLAGAGSPAGSLWLEAKLAETRKGLAAEQLGAADTAALLEEAERWRWGGLRNQSNDDALRSVSLYWAAASGTGPASAAALHQLGWLHVLPARLVPPLTSLGKRRALGVPVQWPAPAEPGQGSTFGSTSQGPRGESQLSALGGGGKAGNSEEGNGMQAEEGSPVGWLVATLLPGVDLEHFFLVSLARRLGWISSAAGASGLAAGSDDFNAAVGGPGSAPGSDPTQVMAGLVGPVAGAGSGGASLIEAALALWEAAAARGSPDAQQVLSSHLASRAFLALEAPTPGAKPGAEPPFREPDLGDLGGGTDPSPGRNLSGGRSVGSIALSYFGALGGSLEAQLSLGFRSLTGLGVAASCENALPYYELAATQAVESFKGLSGRWPGQIALPNSDALDTKLSDLQAGHAQSGGRSAKQGQGKESDAEVVLFFEASAIDGDAAAALNLGNFYLNGARGVVQDLGKARRMFQRVLDSHAKQANGKQGPRFPGQKRKGRSQGSSADAAATAAGLLGVLTYGGVGGSVDSDDSGKALELWQLGAELGDALSMTGLGLLRFQGVSKGEAQGGAQGEGEVLLEVDVAKGAELLETAAKKGCVEALYFLGLQHLKTSQSKAAEAEAAVKEGPKRTALEETNLRRWSDAIALAEPSARAERAGSRARAAARRSAARRLESLKLRQERSSEREATMHRGGQHALEAAEVYEKKVAVEEALAAKLEEKKIAAEEAREESRITASAAKARRELGEYEKARARRASGQADGAQNAEAKKLNKQSAESLERALRCLTTSAQHGHLLALRQLGELYTKGSSRSCPAAVHAFKTVAERSPLAVRLMKSALELYTQGGVEASRMLYTHAAFLGFEVAQVNAAWLLEEGGLHAPFIKGGKGVLGWLKSTRVVDLRAAAGSMRRALDSTAAAAHGAYKAVTGSQSQSGASDKEAKAKAAQAKSGACGSMSELDCEAATLELWRLAARQKNADANVKVGDYAYYGRAEYRAGPKSKPDSAASSADGPAVSKEGKALGWLVKWLRSMPTLPGTSAGLGADLAAWLERALGNAGDPKSAAVYYQQAAESARHPQALWNLGLMHQWGLGVPADVHLAKRHYDSAAAAAYEAQWPAALGVASLRATSLLQPIVSALAGHLGKREPQVRDSDHGQGESRAVGPSDLWRRLKSELLAKDSALLLGLVGTLLAVLELRQHQRRVERAVRQGLDPAGGWGVPVDE